VRWLAVALLLSISSGCREAEPRAPVAPRIEVRAGQPHDVVLITIDTLRADHLGAYGYGRDTSPNMDALAERGTLFERCYTYWPKTRASFVMMLTGRTPSRNGFSKIHPQLLDFNPTLAQLLKDAGYETAAAVDNPNVAANLGYARGFDEYLETWEDGTLATEMDRTRAITAFGRARLVRERERPLFLWLHYVNPHTPYEPPEPFDAAFLEAPAPGEAELALVRGMHGGIPERWAVEGQRRLSYYVAQYDGEIAAVDREVGEIVKAVEDGPGFGRTLVVLTSDHGESLGEHDYYFDHGADLYEPSLAVPLIVAHPGAPGGNRSRSLASTLDVLPTVLDAVKVSFPPDLSGGSLLPEVEGRGELERERLFAENDLHHRATWGERHKLVVEQVDDQRERHLLFDGREDPGELHNVRRERPEDYHRELAALEAYMGAAEQEWVAMRERLAADAERPEPTVSEEACRQLLELGYVASCD